MNPVESKREEEKVVPAHARAGLEEGWFDDAPRSSRRPSTPPAEKLGDFLGDPLADSWLR